MQPKKTATSLLSIVCIIITYGTISAVESGDLGKDKCNQRPAQCDPEDLDPYGDPNDCTKYYECTLNPSNNSLEPVPHTCGEGQWFEDEGGVCDWAENVYCDSYFQSSCMKCMNTTDFHCDVDSKPKIKKE